MTEKKARLFNLTELEGKVSPHQGQVKGGLKLRAAALEFVDDPAELAAYFGGTVEKIGSGEDWAVAKELFPGVVIHFVFCRADSEFPSRLQALYSGDRVNLVHGDELATMTISLSNQLLRYVREKNTDRKLPEVCYRV
ncbi:MAG: hypothetical protein JW901_10460 [Dehalococcoidia bacterium]|nr:hypothetical protein [Dehalococcoidia bacterium]